MEQTAKRKENVSKLIEGLTLEEKREKLIEIVKTLDGEQVIKLKQFMDKLESESKL